MRHMILVLVILTISCFGLNAQSLQGEKAATHFYMINMDESLTNVFSFEKTETQTYRNTSDQGSNEFISCIIDTFYAIASAKLKDELGLELLPLNELHNKIKYSSEYPNCPDMINIKKVLKNASGYQYYADFFVNIYSTFPETSEKLALNEIKPLYAISFTLFDSKGSVIQKIEFSFKSKEPLAKTNKQNESLEQQIKKSLCLYYGEALNGFSTMCKKKLTAQL